MLDKEDLDYLRGLSVFAGLPAEILENLGAHASRRETSGNEVLIHEGEPGNQLYVVLEGELEVIKRRADGQEVCIAVLRPGDVAGEMPLIDIQPRSAEVRSAGSAAVAVLTHGDIATIYKEDQKSYTLLVLNIAREISLRLRRLDKLLADLLFDIRDVIRGAR